MSFSTKIREKILVKSARHCCVCHRYGGVKVEVHHIIPQEQGGDDTEENAIALCFDCHSDAGHYHAKHPRGTRYSPRELRKHKENWFKIVEKQSLQSPTPKEDLLHVRHLVCNDFHVVREILKGNTAEFPISKPVLWNNSVTTYFDNYLKTLHSESDEEIRYANVSDILKVHPETHRDKKRSPAFDHIRVLKLTDIQEGTLPFALWKYGIPLRDIGYVYYRKHPCWGETEYTEVPVFPSIRMMFLAVENLSSSPITINSIDIQGNETNTMDVFDDSSFSEKNIPVPHISLKPNETLLIPEALLVKAVEHESFDISSEVEDYSGGDHKIVYSRVLSFNGIKLFLGNVSLVKSISITDKGTIFDQPIHSFNFENFFTLSHVWMCGSCPHIYAKQVNGSWEYINETILEEQKTLKHEQLFLEPVLSICVSEIEDEETEISRLSLIGSDGRAIDYPAMRLQKGEHIQIDIPYQFSFPATLIIEGRYKALSPTSTSPEVMLLRNKLTGVFPTASFDRSTSISGYPHG